MKESTYHIHDYLRYKTVSVIPIDILEKIHEKNTDNEEKNNILMEDSPVDFEKEATVLGSKILRKDIISITFWDTLTNAPKLSWFYWDVSKNKDESVIAWVKNNNLHIGAKGKIRVESCKELFSGYSSVEKIQFNGCLDTSMVTDMSWMFADCHSLMEVDVSNLDTSQVTNMNCMFKDCRQLQELDTSGFDMSNATAKYYMFLGCNSLPSNYSETKTNESDSLLF